MPEKRPDFQAGTQALPSAFTLTKKGIGDPISAVVAGLQTCFVFFYLEDDMPEIVVQIHAGEGGKDSKNFVHELAGIYSKYSAKKGLV